MLFIKVDENESLAELITEYHGYHITGTDIVVLFNKEDISWFHQDWCNAEPMQDAYTILN